ncbi:MAG: glycoside hydrolase family 3 C-terminal domain-containing protein [Candidatus Heimdallarchaeota archaeon]|nr:glycoside hydrolase family 3 C-terminal domain-containing protein [Candidatus Heimdallarchaeota archaeon]
MDAKKIVQSLSLEEKAKLCTGKSMWEIQPIPSANLERIVVSDGPHGLRKERDISSLEMGTGSVEAICYPTASALANSFNPELIYELGENLGETCLTEDVQVILGPGVNIKRTPLCGRNFEYFSEDPFLAGKMATAWINGVQSKGVGTSLKHFVANNQEKRRMTINAIVDERTLREIYLAAFEEPVKMGKPWTIMGAYNRINGLYACQNDHLLKDVLRSDWGYEGVVLTDWGAADRLGVDIAGGLDLEMPTSGDVGPSHILESVKNGTLDMKELDRAAENIVKLLIRGNNNKKEYSYDKDAHHNKARQIASECITLLKNDDILPIKQEDKIGIIGEMAEKIRFQGGGSSNINPYKVDKTIDEFKKIMNVEFAKGYDTLKDEDIEEYLNEAQNLAKKVEKVIVFVGLPDRYENEGVDRKHLDMPPNQLKLVNKVLEVNSNIIVVITGGSAVKIPFRDQVRGLLFTGLLGEAGAGAIVDILTGTVNPSAKLSESFILDERDDPSYGNYPGEEEVEYKEGIYVGYRFHEKYNKKVAFPFGYGISYTSFEYEKIRAKSNSVTNELTDENAIEIFVTIKNTGERFGKEIVQLYVSEKEPIIDRPHKELKGFIKVALEPGESKEVAIKLDFRSFAYYNTKMMDWHVKGGEYEILVGSSSQDIKLTHILDIKATKPWIEPINEPIYVKRVDFKPSLKINRYTRMEQIKDHIIGKKIYQSIMKQVLETVISDDIMDEGGNPIADADMMSEFIDNMPMKNFVSMTQGRIMTNRRLAALIWLMNRTSRRSILGKILYLF